MSAGIASVGAAVRWTPVSAAPSGLAAFGLRPA
jgi:hypothetical protein